MGGGGGEEDRVENSLKGFWLVDCDDDLFLFLGNIPVLPFLFFFPFYVFAILTKKTHEQTKIVLSLSSSFL